MTRSRPPDPPSPPDAPSTALAVPTAPVIPHAPAPPGPSALAQRPDLADAVADFAEAARAPATHRALRADWAVFTAWCAAHAVPALPATPETAAAFLADQAKGPRGTDGTHEDPKAVATLARYRASIGKMHKLRGHPSPMADPRVKEVMAGIRRRRGVGNPGAKQAFSADVALRSLDALALTHVQGVRDRAILLLGFATALRRAELCDLDLGDLTWREEGVVVLVRKSKTDQERRGREVAVPRLDATPNLCPVRALRTWIGFLHADTGPLFRGLRRGGIIKPTRLTAAQVGKIVQRAVVGAGLNPKAFGGHSLRAGYVTEARAAGQAWATIMEQTGHHKVETVKRYARGTTDPFKTSAAADVMAAFAQRNPNTPSSPWRAVLMRLQEALAVGKVNVRVIGLPPPAADPRALAEFSGDGTHQRLCSSAARWLDGEQRRWSAAPKDLHSAGGVADVATLDGKLFVEAGDTDSGKIHACLSAGQEVLLVPFHLDGVVGLLLSGRPEPAFTPTQLHAVMATMKPRKT